MKQDRIKGNAFLILLLLGLVASIVFVLRAVTTEDESEPSFAIPSADESLRQIQELRRAMTPPERPLTHAPPLKRRACDHVSKLYVRSNQHLKSSTDAKRRRTELLVSDKCFDVLDLNIGGHGGDEAAECLVSLSSFSVERVAECLPQGISLDAPYDTPEAGPSSPEWQLSANPTSAQEFVAATLHAVKIREPGLALSLLPPEFRRDIQRLKDVLVLKMEPENAECILMSIDALVQGITEHRQQLLTDLGKLSKIETAVLARIVDRVVLVWSVLRNEGLDTYSGWRSLQLDTFLAKHGKTTLTSLLDITSRTQAGWDLPDMLEELGSVRVKTIEETERSAVISISFPPYTERKKAEFIKRGDYWVQKNLSDNWSNLVVEWEMSIHQLLEDDTQIQNSIESVCKDFLPLARRFEENGDFVELGEGIGTLMMTLSAE